MTDKYKDLRVALAAGPAAWISQNTMTGADRYARVPIQSLQPGVYKHTPLYSIDLETAHALLAERVALRGILMKCVTRIKTDRDELELCTIDQKTGEVEDQMTRDALDEYDALLAAAVGALAQHQGEKHD